VARPAPTTGGVKTSGQGIIEKGAGLEKVKKSRFTAVFRGTDL
jgi:hypothetical protein